MLSKYRLTIVILLFIALSISYLWCILDNIINSDSMAGYSTVMDPIPISVIFIGVTWLIGHGVHGAAILALPAMFLSKDDKVCEIHRVTESAQAI